MNNVLPISSPRTNSSKWLVSDVIEKNSLSIIVGDSLKTNCYVANMIARSMILGQPWCGKKINSVGSVLYIGEYGVNMAIENGQDLKSRAYPDELFVANNPLNLLKHSQVRKLVDQLNCPDGLVSRGLSLIVLELSYFDYLDVIDLRNVAEAIKNLNYILEKTGVSILLVQTLGSDRKPGIRVLTGMANTAIRISRTFSRAKEITFKVECTKANGTFLTPPSRLGLFTSNNVGE